MQALKQNTPEWHKWRAEGIGASESNIIMGVSKFMSPLQLWDQKVNGKKEEEDKNTFITDKGHKMEEKAGPLFEMEIGYDFPDMLAVSQQQDWLRASLDGYCEELNKCWECKYVGQDDFEKVKNGQVLEQYYPQLQHQLLVTGADSNYLFVVADDKESESKKFPYKTAYIEVKMDIDYVENSLYPSLVSFWNMVQKKKEPKKTELDVVDLSENNELCNLLSDYEITKKELENLTKKEKDLKTKIYKIAKHNKNICNGTKITWSKSADTEKLDFEAYCVNAEIEAKFIPKKISKGRKTQRITFPKGDN